MMSKLLERAIAKVRELPAEDQDTVAVAVLAMTGEDMPIVHLDDETRAAVREGLAQAERGSSCRTKSWLRRTSATVHEGPLLAAGVRRPRGDIRVHRGRRPQGARNVKRAIVNAIRLLGSHPHMAPFTDVPSVRALRVPRRLCKVYYRIDRGRVRREEDENEA